MKKIIYTYILLFSVLLSGQIKDSLPNLSDEYFLVKDGDSLVIQLDEITVLPKHKFKSRTDARYYFWFRKKVYKAYPYAVLAAEKLNALESDLKNIKSKSKQRKHIRKVQAAVEEELTDRLKKMTRTEGRILIKLIHRQTGKTAYENIKEIRSGWKAFWYNSTANVFSLSLKDEYKLLTENEDYLIEDIVQRGIINEKLKYQEYKLDIKPIEILENKKGEVNVDVYKEQFAKRKKKKDRKKKK